MSFALKKVSFFICLVCLITALCACRFEYKATDFKISEIKEKFEDVLLKNNVDIDQCYLTDDWVIHYKIETGNIDWMLSNFHTDINAVLTKYQMQCQNGMLSIIPGNHFKVSNPPVAFVPVKAIVSFLSETDIIEEIGFTPPKGADRIELQVDYAYKSHGSAKSTQNIESTYKWYIYEDKKIKPVKDFENLPGGTIIFVNSLTRYEAQDHTFDESEIMAIILYPYSIEENKILVQ